LLDVLWLEFPQPCPFIGSLAICPGEASAYSLGIAWFWLSWFWLFFENVKLRSFFISCGVCLTDCHFGDFFYDLALAQQFSDNKGDQSKKHHGTTEEKAFKATKPQKARCQSFHFASTGQ